MKVALPMMLLAAVATSICPTLRAADDASQAQKLIDRAVKAIGGHEALEKSRHRIVENEGTYYGMGQGLPYKGRYVFSYGKSIRYRMEIIEVFVIVIDGDKAWMSAQGTTTDIDGDSLEIAKQGALINYATSLIPLQKPNKVFTLSLVDPETIEGEECDGITITREKMPTITMHFSKKTGLIKRTKYLIKAEEQNFKEVVEEAIFQEYGEFDRLKTVTRTLVFRDGKRFLEEKSRKVTYPDTLEETEFKKPE